MILVASHQPRLSGNSINLGLSILLFMSLGCAAKKPLVHSAPTKEIPSTKNTKLPMKIDTVVWKKTEPENSNHSKEKEVININTERSNNKPSNLPSVKKFQKEEDIFRIICLIPFKANAVDSSASKINSSSLRFIQYYAGMTMAFEEMNNNGKKILVDVYDVESVAEVSSILTKYNNRPPHLIIGPQKVDALKAAVDWSKEHQTTLISPWVSSSGITENNPFYVQTKAGLNAHYFKINEHVRNHYPVSNIVLISKSIEESKSKFFNESLNSKDSISEKILKEADLSTGIDPIITPLLKNTGPTVFILPYASSKDENYVYHFLRRVFSEKGSKDVVVYGLYKWLEMKSEILDFMNIYDIRLSVSNYFDQDNNTIKSFKKKYYDRYREFPTMDVLEGYDIAKYAIQSLSQYGPDFQWSKESGVSGLLETNFDIQPAFKSKSRESSRDVDYYENSFLKIIEIKNNKYKIVD